MPIEKLIDSAGDKVANGVGSAADTLASGVESVADAGARGVENVADWFSNIIDPPAKPEIEENVVDDKPNCPPCE